MNIIPPSACYGYPSLALDPGKIVALTHSLMECGYRYRYGAKILPLSSQAGDLKGAERFVDCSGFTRWALFHALGQPAVYDFPDGSQEQLAYARASGFKPSDYESGLLPDSAVRLAVLKPSDAADGVGHVLFVVNARTYESHGSGGPDTRPWGSRPYHQLMSLYVLSPGSEAA